MRYGAVVALVVVSALAFVARGADQRPAPEQNEVMLGRLSDLETPKPMNVPVEPRDNDNGRPPSTASRHKDKFEDIEQKLKSLPEAEALRICLEEAQKLAEKPDAEPEKLEFYMRGLGRPSDPPEVKVLRQILRETRNAMLRAAAIRQLSSWIADDADSRSTVLNELAKYLNDPDRQVRQRVLFALRFSEDIRQLKKIRPLLDDADVQVQQAAAEAIAKLAGWERPPRSSEGAAAQEWIKKAKEKLDALRQKLAEVEAAISEAPHIP